MICPHCTKNIEWVMNVSKYYQRQILDSDGILLEEFEDCNEAIGDTLYLACPECYVELEFDNDGKLVK